jgi:hypothetical protein
MKKHTVSKAEGYCSGAMSSTGLANNMFIRQFNFPDEYSVEDKLMEADSDRLLAWDYHGFRKTLFKFIGKGEGAIGSWVRGGMDGVIEATDNVVMAFIKEALKADEIHPGVQWTGWRVTGTVHRGNGFPIYTLSLFANCSGCVVYSDESAPNVEQPSLDKVFRSMGINSGLLGW